MSVAVFTHDEPQATSGDVHVGGAPVPAVPVAPLPAVPGLLPVEGLEHAAAKIAKQSPKNDTRPVFIATSIPGQTELDLP